MPGNLLSDHVGFVVCLGLEAAVVGPKVDGNTDASDTALVDLCVSAQSHMLTIDCAHHLCCLRSGNRKFHVCISLPEPIEQGISRKESIVCLPGRSDRLRTRVTVQATLLRFGGANQLLPVLKLLGVGCLCRVC
jgi:hypothetical protein